WPFSSGIVRACRSFVCRIVSERTSPANGVPASTASVDATSTASASRRRNQECILGIVACVITWAPYEAISDPDRGVSGGLMSGRRCEGADRPRDLRYRHGQRRG